MTQARPCGDIGPSSVCRCDQGISAYGALRPCLAITHNRPARHINDPVSCVKKGRRPPPEAVLWRLRPRPARAPAPPQTPLPADTCASASHAQDSLFLEQQMQSKDQVHVAIYVLIMAAFSRASSALVPAVGYSSQRPRLTCRPVINCYVAHPGQPALGCCIY